MKQMYRILAALVLIGVFGLNSINVYAAAPSTNSRFITSSNIEQTTATATWINGNGNGRIVLVYTEGISDSEMDDAINNGTIYTANNDFSTSGAARIINDGSDKAVVVYKGTGSTRTVNITGLTAGTKYYVQVYEYKNDGGLDPEYKNGGSNNPVSFTTKAGSKPMAPTNITIADPSDKDGMITWIDGTNAIGYNMDLYNKTSGQMEWEGVDIGSVDDLEGEFLVEGLSSATEYGVRMQSYDVNNEVSDYSLYTYFTTDADGTAPVITNAEYVSEDQFRIYFSEPVEFQGSYTKNKFEISFTKSDNSTVDEVNLQSISLEDGNESAICTTNVDLTLIKNGTDITIYFNGIGNWNWIYDGNNNKMVEQTILLTDWKAPRVASIVRTDDASYGTNASLISFTLSFDEAVKLSDENFHLSIEDVNDNSADGTIHSITPVEEVDGFAQVYTVVCSTSVDNDCDDYSIYISTNYGVDVIRDWYGNELSNTEVLGTEQGYKVDRQAPDSDNNGTLNPDIADANDFNAQAVQLGASFLTATDGEAQAQEVYNLSNLNGIDADDLVIITSKLDGLDCSLEGGIVKVKYSTDGGTEYTNIDNSNYNITETDVTNGYVRLNVNLTALLDGETYEGTEVMFQVTTTDIGGNSVETPTAVYFGLHDGSQNDFLLYDVIAPSQAFDLIKDVDTDLSNEFDNTNEMAAFTDEFGTNNNYNYINLSHNGIMTAIGAFDEDNTLINGTVEIYAKRNSEDWVDVTGYYDQFLDPTIYENFNDGVNNFAMDTEYMYIRFMQNDNFQSFLDAIEAIHGDVVTYSVKVTDKAGNSTNYTTSSNLKLDLVRPLMSSVSINKVKVSEKGIQEAGLPALFTGDESSIEFFNIEDQTAENTIYFEYAIAETTDVSLFGGKAHLQYRTTDYDSNPVTGQIQDDWLYVTSTDGDQDNVVLSLSAETLDVVSYYELPTNTNLYEEINTTDEVNGRKYEFRLVPIDVAGNEVDETDYMTTDQQSTETVVLDNVLPKIVNVYNESLSDYYLQDFFTPSCYDYDDNNEEDDRYYINSNTPSQVDIVFQLFPDASLNFPNLQEIGNSLNSRVQFYNTIDQEWQTVADYTANGEVGNNTSNFQLATNGEYVEIADYFVSTDIAGLISLHNDNSDEDITNTTDLRFELELIDNAGNLITIYPSYNEFDVNITSTQDAFIFRVDVTAPVVSNAVFTSPEGCFDIGSDVSIDFEVVGDDYYTKFVTESSTSVNGVNYSTTNNCEGEDCGDSDIDGSIDGASSSITYNVGDSDNYIEENEVVPFSIQVIDIAGNTSNIITNETEEMDATETPTIDTRLHSNYINTFTALDGENNATTFLYGPNAGDNVISQNTENLRIALSYSVPEYVSNVRVYYYVRNNNEDYYDFDSEEAMDYYGYLTVPAESLEVEEDNYYLNISVSELEGVYEDFANSTENQYLYFGLKFETATCNDGSNVNCDLTSNSYLRIDRQAPRMVTYSDLQESASSYESFANNFSINYGVNYNTDNYVSIDDLANKGYNIFSGPVSYKFGFTNDGSPYSNNKSSEIVQILPPNQSTTNHDYVGYLLMFTETMYAVEFDNSSAQNWYDAPYIDKNNTKTVSSLIEIDNTADFDANANNATTDKFDYHSFGIGKGELINNTSDDFTDNYFAMSFVMNGVYGNAPIEMSIDYTQLVDAAGNRLVNSLGEEVTSNIPFYDGGNDATDISAPIEVDNIAATTSSVAVYSGVNTTGDEPIGTNRMGDECLNTYDKTLYFEVVLNEKNSIPSSVYQTTYEPNYQDEFVEEESTTDDKSLIYIGIIDNTGNPGYKGYIVKRVTPDDYYVGGDLEESQIRLFFNVDFSTLTEDTEEDTYYIPISLSLNELDQVSKFSWGVHWANGLTGENYSYFNGNNFKLDEAGNISIEDYDDIEDANSYTIDNIAPVLDGLTVNIETEENVYSNASCFTATGDGNSVIKFMVSVNEKKVDGDCDDALSLLESGNWTVKIGDETINSNDYTVEELENNNGTPIENDLITYVITLDLKGDIGCGSGYDFVNNETGEYTYFLNARDAAGNVGQSMPETTYVDGIYSGDGQYIYIDNSAPTVEITDITDGCYDNGDQITFKVNVQDISFTASPCTTTFTESDSWTIKLDDNTLTNVSVSTTVDENVYEVTATIPDATFAENTMSDLTVMFDDKVLNEGSDLNEEAVRIIIDPLTAHIEGTGDAYEYTVNADLEEVSVCADTETFGVTFYLSLGEILSTTVKKQTGSDDAVTLTLNEDYTIDGQTITINTDALTDLDNVFIVLETVCGDITSNSFTFNVLPLPATAVITDNNEDADGEICYDATVVFTADADNNDGFSYNWSYKLSSDIEWTAIEANDDNFEIGTNGTTLTVDGISDDYLVSAYKVNIETGCVSTEAGQSETITVLDRIAITTITPSTGGATPKRGETYTYTVSGLTNSTYFEDYSWDYSGTGETITNETSTTVTIEFSNTATPGTLSVVANASKCGSSLPVELPLEITIDPTKTILFSAVGKDKMTVTWTNGTGDGKILLGTQSTGGIATLNKTIDNTVSANLVTLLGSSTYNINWTTASATASSTLLGTTSVPYRLLMDDNNNSQTSVVITGLTRNTRYNFRLIDFINYTSGRVYQPNTNTNSRVTQSKEGDDNYGNTENFISLISPNPAKDNVGFSMNLVNEQPVTIEIFSIEGRQILTFKNNEIMSAGEHYLNIPLGDLAAGTYSIVIRMGDEFILDSFVVMP